jgi:hypothetical protein
LLFFITQLIDHLLGLLQCCLRIVAVAATVGKHLTQSIEISPSDPHTSYARVIAATR